MKKEISGAHSKRRFLQLRLIQWYYRQARVLPWRSHPTPYRVWISEIMLQQTQVQTAGPYFQRFLKQFPDVRRLAAASEDQVLKCWEGLGYYSRARNLHRTAMIIAGEKRGKFPDHSSDWMELPGIGRYTAGAIASIAFAERTPVLDGNVKRVLARIYGVEQSMDENATIEHLWELAGNLVPIKKPGDFNQALMELGALLCRPRIWECAICPAQPVCEAAATGRQSRLPVRRKRPAIPHEQIVAAVIRRRGRYLIGRRPARGLLGGLWEFPGGQIRAGEAPVQTLRRTVREETGLDVGPTEFLARIEHAYSHFSISLHAYRAEVRGLNQRAKANWHTKVRWVKPADLKQYAFPIAHQGILHKLD